MTTQLVEKRHVHDAASALCPLVCVEHKKATMPNERVLTTRTLCLQSICWPGKQGEFAAKQVPKVGCGKALSC